MKNTADSNDLQLVLLYGRVLSDVRQRKLLSVTSRLLDVAWEAELLLTNGTFSLQGHDHLERTVNRQAA
jgi:hypothetical protein